MAKVSISKKVDGNELDLSMSEISLIPVKDLKPLTKVKYLDLSHNIISKIPDDFCKLTNLVSIDLSNNLIKELPSDFGGLQRLQKIDLYNNKLNSLPVSFCYFKNLKWLDLKDNPLNTELQHIVGDCIDDKQCKKCAINVVVYMKKSESLQQQKKQIDLKLQREQDRIDQIEQEKENRRLKAVKLVEKNERRKIFLLEKTQKEAELDQNRLIEEELNQGDIPYSTSKSKSTTNMIPVKTFSLLSILAIILIIGVSAVITLAVMCSGSRYMEDEFCIKKTQTIKYYSELISDHIANLLSAK